MSVMSVQTERYNRCKDIKLFYITGDTDTGERWNIKKVGGKTACASTKAVLKMRAGKWIQSWSLRACCDITRCCTEEK